MTSQTGVLLVRVVYCQLVRRFAHLYLHRRPHPHARLRTSKHSRHVRRHERYSLADDCQVGAVR